MNQTVFLLLALLLASPLFSATHKLSPQQVREQAAKIDALVMRGLKAQGMQPNPTIGDTRFVRRAYLSIVGRIPTLEEMERFEASPFRDKRARLVRALVHSKGYVSHYYNYWADVLRIQTKHPNLAFRNVPSGQAYIDWVKNSLRSNKPYDRMVRELLSADGGLWDRNNGAVGYYFRDFGMPLDHMANTAQVFLGTQIQCAQCHDHPFDKWTQKEFYEMAAYTHGQGNMTSPKYNKVNRALPRAETTTAVQQMKLMSRHAMYELNNTGNGTIKLPADYQYDNGKPGDTVKAAPLYGQARTISYPKPPPVKKGRKPKTPRTPPEGIGSRKIFAEWLANKDNDRFNLVIANRLWKQVMGLGLVEPVDDLRDDSEPSNPALMQHLEHLIVALDYDMKAFLEVLHNTRTWQRAATKTQPTAGSPYYFQGPILRRLTAEQLWDSLIVLTKTNVDRPQPQTRSPLIELRQQAVKKSPEEYAAFIKRMPEKIAPGEKAGGKIYQAMQAAKNEQHNTVSVEERRRKINAEIKELDKQRRKAQKIKEFDLAKGIVKKLQAKRAELMANTHFRASEMLNPLPPAHFVRKFGGSDRVLIQNASDEASIAQVLSLLNGFVDHFILNQRASVLHRNLNAAKTKDEKIRIAFRSILCREPTSGELALMRPEIKDGPHRNCDNMIWALINTHEFMALQ